PHMSEIAPYIHKEETGDDEKFPLRPTRTCQSGSLAELDSLGPSVRQVLSEGITRAPCPGHHTPLLQHRDNVRLALAIPADCRRFICSVCGRRRRSRWLTHLLCIFEQQEALFVWQGERQAFASLSRTLRRASSDYAAFVLWSGRVVVICNQIVPRTSPID